MLRLQRKATAKSRFLIGSVTLGLALSIAVGTGVIGATTSASAAISATRPSTWELGNISTATGSVSSTNKIAVGTMKAWEAWTNSHGGINGHHVNITFEDDQQTPSVGLADAETLIHQKVLALVGSASTTDTTWASAMQQAGIPVIGGSPTSPPFTVTPAFYAQGATFQSGAWLVVKGAKTAGVKKIAVLYCAETPQCAAFNPLLQTAAKQIGGIGISYTAAVSSTAPSYTAQCLAAKSSGATALILTMGASTETLVANQCNQQGFKPRILALDGGVTLPEWTTTPAFNNAVVQVDTFPWWESSSNTQIAQFNEAMKKYYPAGLDNPGLSAAMWASAMMFEDAAKSANLGNNPTSAQVIASLNKFNKSTNGGLTPPLTFTNGNRNVNCGRFGEITNGKFKILNKGQFACAPAS
jgi:branched-chain amino acid transport system substrate-binding protein